KFGVTLDEAFGAALTRHLGLGLLERSDGRVRLSERGLLLSNEVFIDLLPEPAE
ncbi:MAG: oxygen-independent coproporphyrinogen III oxidase, partial [Dehalococcoidia bacterium]|nr:oxygen-independent coproporphyrinogen III oxidase [Dehalococcoidia bacterium]